MRLPRFVESLGFEKTRHLDISRFSNPFRPIVALASGVNLFGQWFKPKLRVRGKYLIDPDLHLLLPFLTLRLSFIPTVYF